MAERPKAVQLVLRLIAKLYQLEGEWDTANVGGKRAALRQRTFARPLHWLRRIAAGLRERALSRSLLGKACAYLLEHWDVLIAHQRHSFTRLDNDLVENAIWPSAMGKKTGSSSGIPMPANARPSSTRSSSHASATARIRSLTFAGC